MRFDNCVHFYDDSEEHYDPELGEYVGGIELLGTLMANVTDIGTERANELLGDYKQRAKVIRTQLDPPNKWAYLMISDSGIKYYPQTARKPLKQHSLIVSELK